MFLLLAILFGWILLVFAVLGCEGGFVSVCCLLFESVVLCWIGYFI